jgi:outer membrane protein assembly factor BamB
LKRERKSLAGYLVLGLAALFLIAGSLGLAEGDLTQTAKPKAAQKKKRVVRTHTPSPTPSPTCSPTPLPVYPQFKADNARLGFLPEEIKPPLTLAWKFKARKAIYSSPAIVGGMVYFGSEDRNLYAVSLRNGALVWKTKLGQRIYSSSPAVNGDMVLISSVDGCLNCLDKASGRVLWKFCAPKRRSTQMEGPPAFSSPLVENGLAYYGTDNRFIYAVSVSTGAKAWEFETEGKIHDNSPALKQGRLFFGSQDGFMYALDAVDGKLLWRSSLSDQTVNTCPAAFNDKVYFGSGDKSFYSINREPDGFLQAVAASNGAKAWQFKTSHGVMSSPAVDPEGRLVFGSADRKIYCLNASSGSKLWSFETGKQVVASPLITGKVVYLGSLDNHFYALSMEKGEVLWNYQTAGGVFSSAGALGSRVVVGDLEGTLYCFESANAE